MYRFYYITALPIIEEVCNVYRRMSHAAMRAGREPEGATLVAVSKGFGSDAVKEAYDAGLRAFGESRVQEAADKIAALRGLNIQWHLIGHLQKNKAKRAVELFDLIHSVDSVELMELLNKYAAASDKVQRALIEVSIAGEETKHGVGEEDIVGLLNAARNMKNLKIEGLMTIPPYFEDPEGSRPYYKRLKALADKYSLGEASMGMTNDFEVAMEEGATIVRVGTAIFGPRTRHLTRKAEQAG